VLGLGPDASEPEVRSAFRRLAKAPLIFFGWENGWKHVGKRMEKCGKSFEKIFLINDSKILGFLGELMKNRWLELVLGSIPIIF